LTAQLRPRAVRFVREGAVRQLRSPHASG
jgi:hypothetical protein